MDVYGCHGILHFKLRNQMVRSELKAIFIVSVCVLLVLPNLERETKFLCVLSTITQYFLEWTLLTNKLSHCSRFLLPRFLSHPSSSLSGRTCVYWKVRTCVCVLKSACECAVVSAKLLSRSLIIFNLRMKSALKALFHVRKESSSLQFLLRFKT